MTDYHVIIGLIAASLALVGDSFYILSILRGDTKPHIFTWLVYALIDGTIFTIQLVHGGGAGAWVLGTAAIANTLITILAISRGEKNITPADWACFLGALGGIVLWWSTGNPFASVLLLTVVNAVALIPTFRKAYARPAEESISVWLVDVIRFSLSIVALQVRTMTTALFPVGVVTVNALLVLMILLRRRKLGRLQP